MYDPQSLPGTGGYGERKSWLSGAEEKPSTGSAGGSNVDKELYKDLVQMVPLVQSLIDPAGKSSFTRRGSVAYTKMPSRESLYRKTRDPKARNAAQSMPVKKRSDKRDKDQGKNGGDENENSENLFSLSRTSSTDQDREELITLREQMQDLQNKLIEKDELLKLTEISRTQMSSTYTELEKLRLEVGKKDSLINSTQLQLSDAKSKLADRQAAVEKLLWEVKTSNQKVEKLEEDLGSMQGDISSYMSLFEVLAKNTCISSSETEYDAIPCDLPHSDALDEVDMQKMEEARLSYIGAVHVAKEKQDEDSIAAAHYARLRLNSLVIK